MAFLKSLLIDLAARLGQWLVGVVSKFISDKQKDSSEDERADKVEDVANQIKELIRAGKPVPKELEDRLRNLKSKQHN